MTTAAEYKIEEGIPIPPTDHNGPRRTKYPFRKMEVGDSFFIPGKKPSEFGGFRTHYGKEGLHFTVRSVDGGIRVWRIA